VILINPAPYIYRDPIMSTLLGYLEEKLGAIDTWPTLILRMLFVEDPMPRSTSTLAFFFFGNWVPIDVAAPFYALCIGRNQFKIIHIMTILFLKWHQNFHNYTRPYITI
jgi:hypothetical protein